MEIGIIPLCLVEPRHTLLYEGKQWNIHLLVPGGLPQKLCQKHRHRQLVRRKGKIHKGKSDGYILQSLQVSFRTMVELQVENHQGLKQLTLHLRLRRLGYFDHKRDSAQLFGEEIHDKLCIPILNGLQYDSSSFYFHFVYNY